MAISTNRFCKVDNRTEHLCEERGTMNIVPKYKTIVKIWYADSEEQLIILKNNVSLFLSLQTANEYAEANPHLDLAFYHEIINAI